MTLKKLTLLFLSLLMVSAIPAESRKRAAATAGEEEIKESVVTGILSPKAKVKTASRKFGACYLRDYAAPMAAVRLIISDGRYREVQAGRGVLVSSGFTQNAAKFFWDDPGANGSFRFADIFITEALHPSENKILPSLSVPFESGSEGLEQMNTGYSDCFRLAVLDKKRSLELFSPLNIKRINDFEYSFGEDGDVDGGHCSTVIFKSKENISWEKTRIKCSGRLFIDKDGFIRKIETQNLEDRYSGFIRQDTRESDIVTPYTLSITYSVANGRLYASSIRQSLRWSQDGIENSGAFHYYAETNPYRMPFKYRYSTETCIDFGTPADIAGKGPQLAEAGIVSQPAAYNNIVLCDSPDYSYWRRTLAHYIDIEKLEHDTGMSWEELCRMAESRQAREEAAALGRPDMDEERIREYKCFTESVRELFLDIYQFSYTK